MTTGTPSRRSSCTGASGRSSCRTAAGCPRGSGRVFWNEERRAGRSRVAPRLGPPMTRAGFVSLIGRPNTGKSTLLNRLVGQKLAIVSPRPQTTRNRITGIKNLPGAQIVFVDTPGLHASTGALGAFMQKTARRAVEDVDLVCLVVDAAQRTHPDRLVLEPLEAYRGPAFCVLNKTDLLRPKARMLPVLEAGQGAHPFRELVPLSPAMGTGCERLPGRPVGGL